MAMNIPTWQNAGVSPSAEKMKEGYKAGECLPANHLNWFINKSFTNLEDAKQQLAVLNAKTVITGSYTGNGNTQTINIGDTPYAVIFMRKDGNLNTSNSSGIAFTNNPSGFSETNLRRTKAKHLMRFTGTPNYAFTDGGFSMLYQYESEDDLPDPDEPYHRAVPTAKLFETELTTNLALSESGTLDLIFIAEDAGINSNIPLGGLTGAYINGKTTADEEAITSVEHIAIERLGTKENVTTVYNGCQITTNGFIAKHDANLSGVVYHYVAFAL